MARNVVQFQKGLSEPAFEQQYGTEEQCRAVVIASRWPNGFECPVCGCRQHSLVTTRDLYQCTRCRRQTSLIAGTIFAAIAAAVVSCDLSPDPDQDGGKRGRGAPGKTPFVAAVETTAEGKPVRLKLRRVTSFCAASIAGFAKRSLDPDCAVVSDGLQCPASPMPGARIRLSRPGRDRRRHARRRSNGSIRRWATSRPPSQEPTAPSTASTCRATSPNSNIASTDDTIWRP